MLQVETIFTKPSSGSNSIKARIQKRLFEVEEGDLITYLNVYAAFMNSNMDNGFCHKNFISYKSMKRVVEVRSRLEKMLVNYDIPIVSCNGKCNSHSRISLYYKHFCTNKKQEMIYLDHFIFSVYNITFYFNSLEINNYQRRKGNISGP